MVINVFLIAVDHDKGINGFAGLNTNAEDCLFTTKFIPHPRMGTCQTIFHHLLAGLSQSLFRQCDVRKVKTG
jgi:hypothetical protein